MTVISFPLYDLTKSYLSETTPISLHKFVNGLTQIVDGLRIACRYRIHHAVPHMVFQNHLAGVVQRGANRGELNQNLRAVVALLHHPFHLFQMSDGPGQPVDDGLLVFVDMTVGMGDAVGVEVGVVVFMVVRMAVLMVVGVLVLVDFRHTLSSLYRSKVYYTTGVNRAQAPEGDILTKINVLTRGGIGTII